MQFDIHGFHWKQLEMQGDSWVVLVLEIVLRLQNNKPTQSHKTKLSKIGFLGFWLCSL